MTPPTSSQSRPTWLIGLGVAVVIVCCLGSGLILTGVGGYFFFSARTRTIRPIATTAPIATASAKATQAPTKSPTATPALTAAPAAAEIEVPNEGFQHVPEGSSITYNHYPPSSGKHYPSPAPWGVYTEPVPEGAFVHNLEHSGIVILYHCPDGCPDLEKQLSDFYDQAPKDPEFDEVKILITPYERELPATMVALAWGWQLNLSEVDEARLLDFYQRHLNQGPEIIP